MLDKFEEKLENLFDQTTLVNHLLAARWLVWYYREKVLEVAEQMVLSATRKQCLDQSDRPAIEETFEIYSDILEGDISVMLKENEDITFKECCEYLEKFIARSCYIYSHIHEKLTKSDKQNLITIKPTLIGDVWVDCNAEKEAQEK